MAEPPPASTTHAVVEIGGKKVHRTTAISDRTVEDLQREITGLAASIARATQRAVTPMQDRKAALEAELAELLA